MRRKLKLLLLGGDLRQARLAELLEQDGHEAGTMAMEQSGRPEAAETFLDSADCVILPLPATGDDGHINAPLSEKRIRADEVIDGMRPGQTIVGGRLPSDLFERGGRRGIRIYDYFEREEMAVLNAIPTVEGAIDIAMRELPVTLHGSSCLVVGYGRIGKLLAYRLQALGTGVTVAARKYADFAWIEAYGHRAVDTNTLRGTLREYDVIFNTVPSLVLDRGTLAGVRRETLIIDLASKPGGVDLDAAKDLELSCIWALSLPGKVAPHTSGRIIRDTIYNIWDEWGCFRE